YSDSVPMLVMSSCLDETAARRGQLHQMKDQEGAARTVCDWSETARTAEAAYGLINRAFTEFAQARPRPKHVQVPISLLETRVPCGIPALGDGRTQPDPCLVRKAASMLKQAQKPLFILGGGARPAWAQARQLLKRSGAASFTTYAARGIPSAEDRLAFGSYLARPESADILAQADCVLAIGTELAEVDLWRRHPGHMAPLIRVDIDPAVLADPWVPADLGILSDATAFLEALASHCPSTRESAWDPAEVADARARWRCASDAEHFEIGTVCDVLRDVLPEEALIFSDMTQIAYTAKEIWDMRYPNRWHHPYGFGTLGYALPAAIGGKVGCPERPVIALAGDYGFQYTLQELGTAAELGLTLPLVLWDNGALKEIENSMRQAQIAPNAVTIRNPDFGRLAEAYGADFAAPRTLPELREALSAALRTGGPTLIRVAADISG
ncbi:MAG: thiamine pyrophosphate-dependent enzyme, partial [Pseudomonadota bacterium]